MIYLITYKDSLTQSNCFHTSNLIEARFALRDAALSWYQEQHGEDSMENPINIPKEDQLDSLRVKKVKAVLYSDKNNLDVLYTHYNYNKVNEGILYNTYENIPIDGKFSIETIGEYKNREDNEKIKEQKPKSNVGNFLQSASWGSIIDEIKERIISGKLHKNKVKTLIIKNEEEEPINRAEIEKIKEEESEDEYKESDNQIPNPPPLPEFLEQSLDGEDEESDKKEKQD